MLKYLIRKKEKMKTFEFIKNGEIHNIKIYFAHIDEAGFNDKRFTEGFVKVDSTSGMFVGTVNYEFIDDVGDLLVMGKIAKNDEGQEAIVLLELNNLNRPIRIFDQDFGEETGSVSFQEDGEVTSEGGKSKVLLDPSKELTQDQLNSRIQNFIDSGSSQQFLTIISSWSNLLHEDLTAVDTVTNQL